MEIGEKGDPGYEYYVVEDISQNSMLIYSKLEHIETLKIVQDVSKKYVTVYASTFYLGVAEIESTAFCKGGAARQVNNIPFLMSGSSHIRHVSKLEIVVELGLLFSN